MITTKTVLVLGAGASAPYGLPTGAALVQLIANDFASPRVVTVEKIMPKEYRTLSLRIRQNQPNSIDEFLERHPSLADVGKQAIAWHLLTAESNSQAALLLDLAKNDHWYRYLKGQLGSSLNALRDNALRVISFNYDRSLEHYLYESFRTCDERISDEECAEALKQLPMLHIYGSLGPLPWQRTDGAMRYGGNHPDSVAQDIQQAGRSIQILHEGADSMAQQNLKSAKDWLSQAEKILFLGFGFHHDSVERLSLKKILTPKRNRTFGTCYGLDSTSRHRVETLVKWPENPNADCYTFLHNHVVLS